MPSSKLLSLCMIVKDEADNLARCLKSAEGIADEIILVDTGSTDKTPQIAEEFGAKVMHHPWTGSFSEARNVSLEQAKGEWILYLDADESLADGKEQIRELLSADPEEDGFFLPIVSFTGTHAYRDAAVNAGFRLFRNRPYCRFTRSLHEQVAIVILSAKPGAKFAHLPILIEHFGYLNPMVHSKSKVRRNVEIAKREVRENPSEAFAWHNLAVEYLRMQKPRAALYCYRRAFLYAGTLVAGFVSSVLKSMASCLVQLGRHTDALALLREAEQAYPDFTDLVYLEGIAHLEQGKRRIAEQDFERCLKMGDALMGTYLADEGVGSYKAYFMLGECRRRAGKDQEAAVLYEESVKLAISRARFFEPAISALIRTLVTLHTPPSEILARFGRLSEGSRTSSLPTLAHLVARGFLSCPPVSMDALLKLKGLLQDGGPSQASRHDGEAMLTLANIDFFLRDYDQAAEAYTSIPMTVPEGGQAWVRGTFSLALSGKWKEARDRLQGIHCADERVEVLRDFYMIVLDCWEGAAALPTEDKPPSREITKHREFLAVQLWEILEWLLQLEEFEYFERALPLLQDLGLPEGERAMQLGKLYERHQFHTSAVSELSRAIELEAADEETYSLLGRICLHQGLYGDAELLFAEALRLENNGNGLSAFMGMAAACLAQGKSDQADLALRGAEALSQ